LWWDISDLRVAPKTTEVRTTLSPTILAQMGQVRSLSAYTQRILRGSNPNVYLAPTLRRETKYYLTVGYGLCPKS